MESKDRQETWAQTNSLLLLGIVDLLEEKGLLDKDGFLERLATFKDESIDIGLFRNKEDELQGDAGYHCGGQQATARMAARIGLSSGDLVLDAGCGAGGPARHLAEAWGLFGCRTGPGIRPASHSDHPHAIDGTAGQGTFQVWGCGRDALRGQQLRRGMEPGGVALHR